MNNVLVPIKIDSITPDRSKYKSYFPVCRPENVVIEIEIPEEEVVFDNDVYYVTKAGLKQIISELADLVDEIDKEYLKKIGGLK